MTAKPNKRERKRLEARKAKLVRELQISVTALTLTNGLSDPDMIDEDRARRSELEAILTRLGEGPLHIGPSHKIHSIVLP